MISDAFDCLSDCSSDCSSDFLQFPYHFPSFPMNDFPMCELWRTTPKWRMGAIVILCIRESARFCALPIRDMALYRGRRDEQTWRAMTTFGEAGRPEAAEALCEKWEEEELEREAEEFKYSGCY